MNKWNIPENLENEIRDRDKRCVYCGENLIENVSKIGSRKSVATWEHIINDAKIINRSNIARCCFSCNSSKGTKRLSDWLQSKYCIKKGITEKNVAEVIRRALKNGA